MSTRHAFTLVELAIALVIIGLLVGGILVGRTLVRASEVNSITTEQARYATAIYGFRDKFFALPGDYVNATTVWGKNSTICNGQAGTVASPGTCSGNGDGYIFRSTSSQNEPFRLWQHLALGGFIEGSFTGAPSSNTVSKPDENSAEIGENIPESDFPRGGWDLRYHNTGSGDATYYAVGAENRLIFANDATNGPPDIAVLTPQDAFNVDTKMDDARPGTGKVLAMRRATCDTSGSPSDFNGRYLASNETTIGCALMWRRIY